MTPTLSYLIITSLLHAVVAHKLFPEPPPLDHEPPAVTPTKFCRREVTGGDWARSAFTAAAGPGWTPSTQEGQLRAPSARARESFRRLL